MLMTLQGPGVGRALRFPAPRQLRGLTDAIAAMPIVVIGGLLVGGYLAHKKIRPFKSLYKKTSAALSGPRRRKRR